MVTCLLILSLPLTVYGSAEDGEMAFEELYNDWEMNGYPDYVGHVIYDSDEDQYVIGLVDPSEAEIDELESKLGDIPNLEKIAQAYDMDYFHVKSTEKMDRTIEAFLACENSALMVCHVYKFDKVKE